MERQQCSSLNHAGTKYPAGHQQLTQNQLNIVTFNYDLSAEREIEAALRATSFLLDEHIRAFMQAPRFIHMYGALERATISANDFAAFDGTFGSERAPERSERAKVALDACAQAAKNIRVIDPHNKDDGPESKQAHSILDTAEQLYFLGFGFDPNNVARLSMKAHSQRPQKKIYFTNLDNAMTVNKRVATSLELSDFRNPDAGIAGRANWVAEKSTRDCYHALSLDFGPFDDCSIPQ
jgi:hypothetical protein